MPEEIVQPSRVRELFRNKKDSDKVVSLFITAGYPELDATVDLILGFEKNGAEMIELGIPFSDPLADGPTVQYASNIAIENGITLEKIFHMIREIRKKSQIPLVLMGYINPILRYGVEKFCRDAAGVGADGLIIPDLPPEESALITDSVHKNHLDMVYLVAPNTTDERMQQIDQLSSGFVYCVSVTGVTGARSGDEIEASVNRFIHRVHKNITRNPKMIGFGIRSFEDAQKISEYTDGFIVGSALIDTIRKSYPEENWQDSVFDFVRSLSSGPSN